MRLSVGESFKSSIEKVSSRTQLLALLLPILVSCDSNKKPLAKASPVAFVSASAPISIEQPFASSKSIKDPVICINGYLEAGEKDLIINRIRRAFEKMDVPLVRINPDNFKQKRDDCDGMIAVGGDDLDTRWLPKPAPLHSKAVLTPAHRQAFDESYIRWAREEKKPLLAECLGMQQVTVYEGEGGYLIQHIPDIPSALNHRENHLVYLNDRGAVFGLGSLIRVRSRHHQSIREPLPSGLEVAGRGPDGLVEALVSKDDLVWGIMWHPKKAAQQVIYKNFVSMVEKHIKEKLK